MLPVCLLLEVWHYWVPTLIKPGSARQKAMLGTISMPVVCRCLRLNSMPATRYTNNSAKALWEVWIIRFRTKTQDRIKFVLHFELKLIN